MKIITQRNNKDYYDYLVSIYGIDEKVVYDRRNHMNLKTSESPFFNLTKLPDDKKKEKGIYHTYDSILESWSSLPEGKIMKCILEAGNKWFIFRVERFLDENDLVNIEWRLIKKYDIDKNLHYGSTPVSLLSFKYWSKRDTPQQLRRWITGTIAENPILKDTKVASLVEAEEIYQGVYSYLSSLNDIDYKDSRNDIEKLQSAGFDKKISFRNVK